MRGEGRWAGPPVLNGEGPGRARSCSGPRSMAPSPCVLCRVHRNFGVGLDEPGAATPDSRESGKNRQCDNPFIVSIPQSIESAHAWSDPRSDPEGRSPPFPGRRARWMRPPTCPPSTLRLNSDASKIALQEVRGNLKGLRHLMKALGPDWAFLLTDVNRGEAGNDERMAFVFDRAPGATLRAGLRACRTPRVEKRGGRQRLARAVCAFALRGLPLLCGAGGHGQLRRCGVQGTQFRRASEEDVAPPPALGRVRYPAGVAFACRPRRSATPHGRRAPVRRPCRTGGGSRPTRRSCGHRRRPRPAGE